MEVLCDRNEPEMQDDGRQTIGAMPSGGTASTSPVVARPGFSREGEKFQLGYRPALDGLRGVAILAVMATHANIANGWAGEVGVDIFFVLSGFLITSLLVEEWDRFHSISLRKFYARRGLRLLPALVVMIAVIVTWHWASNRRVASRTALDGLMALLYSSNWMFALGIRQPVHVFAHTWTLSIEEQFYLWWPLMLMLLLHRCSSRGSLIRWVMLGIFLLMIEKVVVAVGMVNGSHRWLSYATDARADTLLVGCLAAIVLCSKPVPQDGRLKRALKYSAWLVGIPGLILIGIPASLSADFCAIGLHLITAIFATLILVEAVISQGMLGWLLSRRWLVYIGKVSYGLYLWHYPIFCEVQTRKWPFQYELAAELALTVLATIMSFCLIERPALKLKVRFGRINKEHAPERPVFANSTRLVLMFTCLFLIRSIAGSLIFSGPCCLVLGALLIVASSPVQAAPPVTVSETPIPSLSPMASYPPALKNVPARCCPSNTGSWKFWLNIRAAPLGLLVVRRAWPSRFAHFRRHPH
jgi:peptidoglycan/LPS O-acetylase OafA/YrhL